MSGVESRARRRKASQRLPRGLWVSVHAGRANSSHSITRWFKVGASWNAHHADQPERRSAGEAVPLRGRGAVPIEQVNRAHQQMGGERASERVRAPK